MRHSSGGCLNENEYIGSDDFCYQCVKGAFASDDGYSCVWDRVDG